MIGLIMMQASSMVEHKTVNFGVPGSSPGPAAKFTPPCWTVKSLTALPGNQSGQRGVKIYYGQGGSLDVGARRC